MKIVRQQKGRRQRINVANAQRIPCAAILLFGLLIHALYITPCWAGAPAADDTDTVALWLFDEPNYLTMLMTDAGENWYDLGLSAENATLSPGKFGRALAFQKETGLATIWANGSQTSWSRLRPFPYFPRAWLEALAEGSWTIDFWLKLDTIDHDAILLEAGAQQKGPHTSLMLRQSASSFVLISNPPGIWYECPTDSATLRDGKFHHVAFTVDLHNPGKRIVHYVDGRPQTMPMPKGEIHTPVTGITDGLVCLVYADPYLATPIACKVVEDFAIPDSPYESFSARWLGMVSPSSDSVAFRVKSDGAVTLDINGKRMSSAGGPTEFDLFVDGLTTGMPVVFELDYYRLNNKKPSSLQVLWSGASQELAPILPEAFSCEAHLAEVCEAVAEVGRVSVDSAYVFSIGRNVRGEQGMVGQVDELRLSKGVLYGGPFSLPGSASQNHDANTPVEAKPNGLPLLFEGSWPGPVRIGSRKHVFIDDAILAEQTAVELRINPPQQFDPVTQDEKKPWELETEIYPDAIIDEGHFTDVGAASVGPALWENGTTITTFYGSGGMWKSSEHLIMMARSEDGLHFTKPDLGLVEWRGSKDNNIISRYPGQGTFFIDVNPLEPPERLYKWTAFGMERATHVFYSSDGLNWRRNETIGIFSDCGGGVEPFWDDQRGRYVIYLRHEGFLRGNRGATGRSSMVTATDKLLEPWPFDSVLNPERDKITEELPLPFFPTEAGEVYRTCATKYRWAPDTYVAFPWRMLGDHAYMQTELATSRDGVNWCFWGDKPYYYGVSEKNPSRALAANGLLRRGDEIWQYVRVDGKGHYLARAKQRLDGFVSLEGGASPGAAVTKNLIHDGAYLELNVAAPGRVRVGLLRADGAEIEGYGIEDCDAIQTDSVHHVVTWHGKSDVRLTAGYVMKVKFELQNAKLFAFQFLPSDEAATNG